jgi:poly(ribitol-phosphate) beta-N-acetylglucosaminyltransferase
MDVDEKIILNFSELKSANLPVNKLFELQVNKNHVKYEFLVRFSSNNKNLICFGSGAYYPKKFSPPVYNRHRWQSEFEESVIYYNDPTLYNNSKITLGWGVGKNEEWYLLSISEIIRILASKNRVTPENILFFGSSGGGFTSIILSTLFKNSAAIVNNPQVFVMNYNKAHIDNMMEACFDNSDLDTVLNEYGHRFDAIRMFKREGYIPPINYLINIDSKADVINQLMPFINSLLSFDNFNHQMKVLSYPNPEGHNGLLEKEDTLQLIKNHFLKKPVDITHIIKDKDQFLKINTTNVEYDDGISVITPSYKGEKHISKLLDSIKNQELPYNLFEVIIVINGVLDGTYQIIKDFEEKNPDINIKISYTERASASHARNIAISEASRKYSTFIDDDDYISSNYLKELYNHASENRIVIAGFFDVDENTGKLSHSYVTPELLSNSGVVDDPYKKLVGILTMCTCKLILTDKLKKVKFNDKLKSGVDTPFYCKLYAENKFEFYVIGKEKEAIYYRIYRDDSLSRRALSYQFNVLERLSVINDLNQSLKITEDTTIKNFIKGKIRAQIQFIHRYLAQNPHQVEKICKDVEEYSYEYFPYNQMNRGLAKKLIISYNFPPFACTSGNNMAKRVNEQAEIVDIIHNKVKRSIDKTLNLISDKYIDKKIMVNSSYTFGGWKGTKQFCEKGMEEIDKIVGEKGEYEEIYSRSMFPASHFLAFEYKIKYPNVKWTAEFSDPLIYDIKGNVRKSDIDDPKFMNRINKLLSEKDFPKVDSPNIFLLCEYLSYVFADELVFTNENQKEYMMTKFPYQEIVDVIGKKSQIKKHYTLGKEYYKLIESNYQLDDEYVNIAYFGAFYDTRNLEEIYSALYALNENYQNKCKLHLFTSNVEDFQELMECSPVKDDLNINHYVGFFEFLNLTTKFDCLIVNDANTKDYKKINPYLPSKLSDYLGSGTDIWIIYEEDSVMSRYDVKYKSRLGSLIFTMETLEQIIKDHTMSHDQGLLK